MAKKQSKAQLRAQVVNQYETAKREMELLSSLIYQLGEIVLAEDECLELHPSLAAIVDLQPLDWGNGGTEFGVVLEAIANAVGPLDWGNPGTEFAVVLGATLEALKPMDWGNGGTEFVAILSNVLAAQNTLRVAKANKSRNKKAAKPSKR